MKKIEPLVTVSAGGWVVGDFVRYMSRVHGVSCVLADGLESKKLAVELNQVPLSQVFNHVAKRLGVEVRLTGGVYYLGELDRSDRAVLIRRVRRLSGEDLALMVTALLSDGGTSATFNDGLVVLADSVEVVEKINRAFDDLEAVASPTWIIQLQVVSYGESSAREFGVDVTPAAKLAASIVSSGGGLDLEASAELDAVLQAVASDSGVDLVADPLLCLGDGETASFDRLENVPYRTVTTEDTGTRSIERENIDFIPIGFKVNAQLRELTGDSALIELAIENSTIAAVNDGLPPTAANEVFKSVVPVSGGGVYLVGAFESKSSRLDRRLGLNWISGRSDGRRFFQVWLRAYRVAGTAEERKPERAPQAVPVEKVDQDESNKEIKSDHSGRNGGDFLTSDRSGPGARVQSVGTRYRVDQ